LHQIMNPTTDGTGFNDDLMGLSFVQDPFKGYMLCSKGLKSAWVGSGVKQATLLNFPRSIAKISITSLR
jgi:hypothetical protein